MKELLFKSKISWPVKILLTILSLQSCSKEKQPTASISLDYNGKLHGYSFNTTASLSQSLGKHNLRVSGTTFNNTTGSLILEIKYPDPIKPSIYSETAGANFEVNLNLSTPGGILWGIPIASSAASGFFSSSNPVSITITELTPVFVKGTFKGDIRDVTLASGSGLPVTNGHFLVYFN